MNENVLYHIDSARLLVDKCQYGRGACPHGRAKAHYLALEVACAEQRKLLTVSIPKQIRAEFNLRGLTVIKIEPTWDADLDTYVFRTHIDHSRREKGKSSVCAGKQVSAAISRPIFVR